MASALKKWDRLSEEKKRVVIDEFIHFFEEERGEQIGKLAAEQILNFFLESAGTELYNKGVQDAKKAVESRFEEIKYDLDDLLDL